MSLDKKTILSISSGLLLLSATFATSAQVTAVPPPSRGPVGPPVVSSPSETVTFSNSPVGELTFATGTFTLAVGDFIVPRPHQSPSDLSIDAPDDSTHLNEFRYELEPKCEKAVTVATTCYIVFGFLPAKAETGLSAELHLPHHSSDVTTFDFTIIASAVPPSVAAASTDCTNHRFWLPSIRLLRMPPGSDHQDATDPLAHAVSRYFGDPQNSLWREAEVNCFYATDNSLAFFTQFQTIYNGASGGATINANIGSYNFGNGLQMSLGTNIQAGSNNATPSGTTSSLANIPPTISKQAAAQGAQNLFYGGNIYVYALLPITSTPKYSWSRLRFDSGLLLREGVDIQNFTGTNTTGSSPTTHFNFLGESYLQYDANPDSTGSVPLSVFLGSEIGYAYTSHAYARQYGLINNLNSQIADVAFGLLVNNHFNVAVSREFGPSQTYIDSTSNTSTTQNNFKSYNFAITYQSSGVGK